MKGPTMKIRKWKIKHHPTGKPIPKAFYTSAVTLMNEHNVLVDKIKDLEEIIRHLSCELSCTSQ